MPTIFQLKQHLNFYPDDTVVVYDLWSIEDVNARCAQRNILLTKEEAEYVLELMDRKKDANNGLTWEVMDYYIDEVKNMR